MMEFSKLKKENFDDIFWDFHMETAGDEAEYYRLM